INENPEIIYTYDFTHQIALWLKQELSKNQKFQEFLHQCNLTRSQIMPREMSNNFPGSRSRTKKFFRKIRMVIDL
ncbi:MAG: hypothetical protein AB4426_13340, partial [Xenococcaceae cyanobacterium]